MNVADTKRPIIEESMRIGGKKVKAEGVVPVHYPYTNEVIGTAFFDIIEQVFGEEFLDDYVEGKETVTGEKVALSHAIN